MDYAKIMPKVTKGQPYVHQEYPKFVNGTLVKNELEEAQLLAAELEGAENGAAAHGLDSKRTARTGAKAK